MTLSKQKMLPSIYFFLILCQIPITAVFFSNSQDIASGIFGAADISALATLMFLAAYKANRGVMAIRKPPAWFIPVPAYILWCLASWTWSISGTPIFDAALITRDIIRCLNLFLIIILIGPTRSHESLLETASYSAIIYAALSFASMSFADESSGGVGRYYFDEYKDSVGVSRQAAILCILAIAATHSKPTRSYISLAGIVGCALICFMAFSKAAILSLALSTIIAYGIYKATPSRVVSILSISVASLAIALIIQLEYILFYINSPAGLTSFSGRLLIWEELARLIPEKPMAGYGLNPVFTLLDGLFYKTPGTAHNDIMQQLISYGAIGLILWVGVQISILKAFRKNHSIDQKRLILAFSIFFLTFGMTESVLVLTAFPMYLVLYFCTLTATQQKKSKSA